MANPATIFAALVRHRARKLGRCASTYTRAEITDSEARIKRLLADGATGEDIVCCWQWAANDPLVDWIRAASGDLPTFLAKFPRIWEQYKSRDRAQDVAPRREPEAETLASRLQAVQDELTAMGCPADQVERAKAVEAEVWRINRLPSKAEREEAWEESELLAEARRRNRDRLDQLAEALAPVIMPEEPHEDEDDDAK